LGGLFFSFFFSFYLWIITKIRPSQEFLAATDVRLCGGLFGGNVAELFTLKHPSCYSN